MLDTEFVRETTYFSQLALIQFGFESTFYILDPLDVPSYDSLTTLFSDPTKTKILHSCYQDLEIFYHANQIAFHTVFDTQVAAAFLGYGLSISYQRLVEDLLGISLDKSKQHTNWLRRPLSDKHLEYAANDVYHLDAMHQLLKGKLEEKGYLDWALEEMKTVSDTDNFMIDYNHIWKKTKFASTKPLYLEILKRLSSIREEFAVQYNKPRKHILSDDDLSMICLTGKVEPDIHKKINKFSSMSDQFNHALVDINDQDPESFPSLKAFVPLSNAHKKTIKELKAILTVVSEETGIESTLIARSRDIESFVKNPSDDYPFMKRWRGEIFGSKLTSYLESGN